MNVGAGNWCAAASGLLGLAGGGLLPAAASEVDAAASADTVAGRLDEAVKASALGPVISANSGGVPASARVGQASSVGGLSVPPSWAGEAAAAVSPRTAALVSAGSSAAAPHSAPLSTMPAGMPSVARVGKAAGLIAPRYGVKPTVMPKPVGL